MRLGQITRRWSQFDDDGVFEYREQVQAIAQCPVCGVEVALLAETDAWAETKAIIPVRGKRQRLWKHDGYGPAAAEHCGKLIADWWEGTFVYDLEEPCSSSS